jgi:hypothetical protein
MPQPFFQAVGANALVGFGRGKGMPEAVAACFLFDIGKLEIFGNQFPDPTL